MTYSTETKSCEWCGAKDDLLRGETANKLVLLTCKDGYACGERWPDVPPVGRVGVYEGSVGA
jgi:hypothetical protein